MNRWKWKKQSRWWRAILRPIMLRRRSECNNLLSFSFFVLKISIIRVNTNSQCSDAIATTTQPQPPLPSIVMPIKENQKEKKDEKEKVYARSVGWSPFSSLLLLPFLGRFLKFTTMMKRRNRIFPRLFFSSSQWRRWNARKLLFFNLERMEERHSFCFTRSSNQETIENVSSDGWNDRNRKTRCSAIDEP